MSENFIDISKSLSTADGEPDRNLALELVRVTEAAAIAAGQHIGTGDKNTADGAAVDAMRSMLASVRFNGVVVIGEGEKDEAPMLFNGEKVGDGSGPECDVAVDPIDGTRLTAQGMDNAVAVLAVSERGAMYDAHDVFYMEKLCVGPEAAGVVSLEQSAAENVRAIAAAKKIKPQHVTVAVLDRPRHKGLIEEIISAGARVRALIDGDVAGAIYAAREGTGVDALMGIGGSPEGVVTACAMKALGGSIQGRLWSEDEKEREAALEKGHSFDRILTTNDLVSSDNCYFAASGITNGDLLRGVRYTEGTLHTQSIVMRSKSGTVRVVDAEHQVEKWADYERK